jgi:hypothetical protein
MPAVTGSPEPWGMSMPASYYRADAENGDGIDDPSEDALFMLFSELNHTDNTFVVIQPDADDPDWFASVSRLDEAGYEVELRDVRHREHELTVQNDIGRIAKDLTVWMAARNGAKPSAEF